MTEAAATIQDWEAPETLDEERVMRLREARHYLNLREATTEAAKRVAEKLNEEIARGHDTLAFLCAIGLAVLKDAYDIYAAIVIAEMAAAIVALVSSASVGTGAAAGAATGAAVGAGACIFVPILGSIVCGIIGTIAGAITGLIVSVAGVIKAAELGMAIYAILWIIKSLVGLFLSLALYYFLWGKGWFIKTRIRVIWWVFGFVFDNLPLASELPTNTLNVLYAWHLVRKRARAAEEKLPKLKKLTEKEIEELDNDISKLDEE